MPRISVCARARTFTFNVFAFFFFTFSNGQCLRSIRSSSLCCVRLLSSSTIIFGALRSFDRHERSTEIEWQAQISILCFVQKSRNLLTSEFVQRIRFLTFVRGIRRGEDEKIEWKKKGPNRRKSILLILFSFFYFFWQLRVKKAKKIKLIRYDCDRIHFSCAGRQKTRREKRNVKKNRREKIEAKNALKLTKTNNRWTFGVVRLASGMKACTHKSAATNECLNRFHDFSVLFTPFAALFFHVHLLKNH